MNQTDYERTLGSIDSELVEWHSSLDTYNSTHAQELFRGPSPDGVWLDEAMTWPIEDCWCESTLADNHVQILDALVTAQSVWPELFR